MALVCVVRAKSSISLTRRREIRGWASGAPLRALAAPMWPTYHLAMDSLRFVYWQDGTLWLGHLEAFPDYMTQGESFDDLKLHLRDLYLAP
jgi:hypothetical protein